MAITATGPQPRLISIILVRLILPMASTHGKPTFMKDVLSDILDTVALKGTLYFRTDFSPPFAIGVPAHGRAARFHIVVQGRCHVTLPGGEAVCLGTNELVLVPHGSAHVLADAPDRAPTQLEEVIAASGYSGEGSFVVGSGDQTASTRLVCGHFSFADGADHPLLRALPSLLHITTADRARWPMLNDVLNLMVRRIFEEAAGAVASVTRLSEVIYIEILRVAIDRAPELTQLFSAVYDPQIGRALRLIHHRYREDWTVDNMAVEIAMSRSRFAERFRELVGVAPIAYLTDWRLQRARALLCESGASVQEISYLVGYKSADAFSRAFSQQFGQSPKSFRRKSA
jgi:AraC-like DNA-binding protein/mannose-6-phosphate isomerase-like protein (cupin superfamily)